MCVDIPPGRGRSARPLAGLGLLLCAALASCAGGSRPLPPVEGYRSGLRLWHPLTDFYAFRELYRRGEITVPQWLRSIAYPQTFAFFHLGDPVPAVVGWARLGRGMISRRIERAAARFARVMMRS